MPCAIASGVLGIFVFHQENSTDTGEIAIVAGPELAAPAEDGTYQAVWLDLAQIAGRQIWPSAPARLLAVNRGRWPAGVVVETTEP